MSDAPDIAIVGMACRFPGATEPERFWQNLCDGVEAVRPLTDAQIEADGVPVHHHQVPGYVKAAVVLDDVDRFDAEFFGIPADEAKLIDPQQRIFLECAWHALEDAGYDPRACAGAVGVYAGTSPSKYQAQLPWMFHESFGAAFDAEIANDPDYLACRVSHKLDLRGPSFTVQSASSTSLVAVCLACDGLLNFQCDMALAGGVSLTLPQHRGYFHRPGMILSPDGHTRTFDARAAGTIVGSGAGVVVLKRLADAVAARDTIYGVIRGWAVNNDGARKLAFTAPSEDAQAAVVADALGMAGVEPDTIGYVEAHGLGTPLGDAIEVAALRRVFRTAAKGACALGAVKTNVGHLKIAAGIAGLMKATLVLRHGKIPPNLHFETPNPRLDFAGGPFYVPTRLTPWERNGHPRRAGVSSFGIGGTNAHVVLEEPPPPALATAAASRQLLVWSGRTPAALDRVGRALAAHLARPDACDVADAAYTLGVGRRPLRWRRAVVCRDRADAARALAEDGGRIVAGEAADDPAVVLVLSGAPAAPGVARALATELPAFARHFEAEVARARALGVDLDAPSSAAARALAGFAFAHALGRFLLDCGIRPRALVADGPGAVAAACLVDALGPDAAAAALARGETPAAAAALAGVRGVRWAPTLAALGPEPANRVTLGIGPATPPEAEPTHPAGDGSPLEALLAALACLWVAGLGIDWRPVHGDGRRRIPLPTYPFERTRHWVEDDRARWTAPQPASRSNA